jgi:hypothetical protein
MLVSLSAVWQIVANIGGLAVTTADAALLMRAAGFPVVLLQQ